MHIGPEDRVSQKIFLVFYTDVYFDNYIHMLYILYVAFLT